jgi:hypothetical protein
MLNERIAESKARILEIVQTDPPSSTEPITIIEFCEIAGNPEHFVDLINAESRIQALEATGSGTDIAKGLIKTIETIKAKPDENVVVYLFSDLEHLGDQNELDSAISAMNALFAGRTKKSRSNTVVIQQWGGITAIGDTLRKKIDNSVAKIIDVKSTKKEVVAVTPSVTVIEAKRDKKRPTWINAVLKIDAASKDTATQPLKIDAEILTSRTMQKNFTVDLNQPETVKLSFVTTSAEEAAAVAKLDFRFTHTTTATPTSSIVCDIKPANIGLLIPLEKPEYIRFTTVSDQAIGMPIWTDPINLKAKFKIEMQFDVRSLPDDDLDPSTYQVLCKPPARILSGPKEVQIAPNTKETFTFEVETTSINQSSDDFKIDFECRTLNEPVYVTQKNKVLLFTLDNLGGPTQLLTSFEQENLSIQTGRWASITNPVAFYSGTVALKAKGNIAPSDSFKVPLADQSSLRVKSSPLKSEYTQVPFEILVPRNKFINGVADIEIFLEPPAQTPAIRYVFDTPITVSLKEPPAIALVSSQIVASVDSEATRTQLPINLELPESYRGHRGVIVEIEPDQVQVKGEPKVVEVGLTNAIWVSHAPAANTSWFFDSRRIGQLAILPKGDQPIMVLKVPFAIVSVALLKKYIPFAFGFFAIGLVGMLVRKVFFTDPFAGEAK